LAIAVCFTSRFVLVLTVVHIRGGRGGEAVRQERREIVTLPPTIAKLTAVKHLMLHGSNLVRIPPEIGVMTSLEEFTPYTPTDCTGSRTRSPNARGSPGAR
jgi:hypothetical protein